MYPFFRFFSTDNTLVHADALQQSLLEKAETFLARSTAEKYVPVSLSTGVNHVEIIFVQHEKSYEMSVELRKSALIQPKTSLKKKPVLWLYYC